MESRVRIPRREDAEVVLTRILLKHETIIARNYHMFFSENNITIYINFSTIHTKL